LINAVNKVKILCHDKEKCWMATSQIIIFKNYEVDVTSSVYGRWILCFSY